MKKIHLLDKNVKADEILFIDNRDYNLEPARKLGIKTILFENNKQLGKELRKYGVIEINL